MSDPFVSRRLWLKWLAALPVAQPLAAHATTMPLLLAQEAAADVDPQGYMVSEKYDGVRAYWDGRGLRFRSGAPIAAPRWFLQRLPALPLDGELWLGRGRFDAVSGLLRRSHANDDATWHALRYMVFELPSAAGSFFERARRIHTLAAAQGWQQLVAVDQQAISSRTALRRRLDAVVAGGGEGLVLHRGDAPYLSGRSAAMLKLKPQFDAEAEVLAQVAGQGRHAGRMGALRVRTAQGVIFMLGSGFSDAQRDDPPPVGSRVTFRYRGLTPAGVPRFASFWRMAGS